MGNVVSIPAPPTDEASLAAWTRQHVRRPVLVVDDEAPIRDVLARFLRARGYRVVTAASADEALLRMAEEPAAVALCDIRMPGRNGVWLLHRLRTEFPDTAVVMVTAFNDVTPAIASHRQGVVDYLTKPFTPEQITGAVRRAVEWHVNLSAERQWAARLEREASERETRLVEATHDLVICNDETVDELLSVLTRHDSHAYAHARRVASLAVLLSDRMGRADADKRVTRRAALLHDVGKGAIPPAVIDKPAPLTGEEYELVRTHPARAHRLLADISFLSDVADIVRAVHERPDGHGFPDGRTTGQIPLGARVIAIANAYDVMTSEQIYRPALPAPDALLELERGAGSQFDASLVPLFVGLLRTH